MVELLAGAFTGAAMEGKSNAKNWGSLVIAIDPIILGPDTPADFQAKATAMCDRVKNAKRLPGSEGKEIYLPGERGDAQGEENIARGTLRVSATLYRELVRLSEEGSCGSGAIEGVSETTGEAELDV
jgi:LDH2 family malate/lactate/ureidoglycolate dehydrogenase